MRRLVLVLLLAGCSSQFDTADASYFATPTVSCCTPSPAPACCMDLGGIMIDHNCPLTCNLPDPATPGWSQTTDSFGCPVWKRPVAPFGCAGGDAAVSCTPGDVSSYTPHGLVPTGAPSSSCTTQQLQQFYDSCLGPSSSASSCYAIEQSAPSCSQCLLSTQSDSTWGAVITTANAWDLNIAGCTALVTGDSSVTSCAARIAATIGCDDVACGACPFTPGETTTSRQQCTQAADVGPCRVYVDAQCDAGDAGYSICRVNLESSASFVAFASVFCNP